MSNVSALRDGIAVPPSVDFVFEMGMHKIRDQIEVFDALDTKIGVLLGFIVVSVAEILGFILLAAAENVEPTRYFTKLVQILFFVGLGSVALATVFGFIALRIRRFAIGFKFPEMIPEANRSADEIRAIFLDDLLQSTSHNRDVLDKKQKYASAAIFFVVIGLFCYTIVLVLLFLSLAPKG